MPLSSTARRNIGLTSLANSLVARDAGRAMESTESKLLAADRAQSGLEAQTLANTLSEAKSERLKLAAQAEAVNEQKVKAILKSGRPATEIYNELTTIPGKASENARKVMKETLDYTKAGAAPDPQVAENRRLEGMLKQQQIDRGNAPADPYEGYTPAFVNYLKTHGVDKPTGADYEKFQEYSKATAKAGASTISQTVGGTGFELSPGETKQFYESYIVPATDSKRAMGNLQGVINVASRSGDKAIGLGGKVRAVIAPLANAAGIQSETMDDAQLLQILFGERAGSLRKDVIGPGQVSEFEQRILQQVSGKTLSSEEGLKKLLNHHWEINEKKQTLANKKIDELVEIGGPRFSVLYEQFAVPEKPAYLLEGNDAKAAYLKQAEGMLQ